MIFRFESPSKRRKRKHDERASSTSRWTKKFFWWPTQINEASNEYIWLEYGYRQYRYDHHGVLESYRETTTAELMAMKLAGEIPEYELPE